MLVCVVQIASACDKIYDRLKTGTMTISYSDSNSELCRNVFSIKSKVDLILSWHKIETDGKLFSHIRVESEEGFLSEDYELSLSKV